MKEELRRNRSQNFASFYNLSGIVIFVINFVKSFKNDFTCNFERIRQFQFIFCENFEKFFIAEKHI